MAKAIDLFEAYGEIVQEGQKELFSKKETEQLVDPDYYERELYVIQDKIEEIWLYLNDVLDFFTTIDERDKIKNINKAVRFIDKNIDFIKADDGAWKGMIENQRTKNPPSVKAEKAKFFRSVEKVKDLMNTENKLLKKYKEAIENERNH